MFASFETFGQTLALQEVDDPVTSSGGDTRDVNQLSNGPRTGDVGEGPDHAGRWRSLEGATGSSWSAPWVAVRSTITHQQSG